MNDTPQIASTPLAAYLVFTSFFLAATPATAQISIYEGDDSYLEFGGYVQSVSGVQYFGYDVSEPDDSTFGLNSQVIRLEWTGAVGDSVRYEVHNRLFSQVTSMPQGLLAADAEDDEGGNVIGLGASAAPDRTLDLSTDLLDENGLLLNHDVDRAAVRFYTEAADITLGRQAITWGRSALFPVADLWTKFSPFELDQTQKRGADAGRVLIYPSFESELEFVVADRGSLDDLSAGLRASRTFGWGDGFVAAGKLWDRAMAMAGITLIGERLNGRLEVVEPFDIDDGEFKLPRVTAGGDYLRGDLQLSVEYHFNGAGADSPSGYAQQLESEVFSRGESYFLGRHYVGGLVNWSGFERTDLSLSAITNVGDPSVILAPNFRYILSDDADINAGAFQGFGEEPTFGVAPELNSEYGTYGGLVYTQLRVFY